MPAKKKSKSRKSKSNVVDAQTFDTQALTEDLRRERTINATQRAIIADERATRHQVEQERDGLLLLIAIATRAREIKSYEPPTAMTPTGSE